MSDPYVRVTCSHLDLHTPVIKDNLDPFWDYAFLACLPPAPNHVLKLQVYDSNKGRCVRMNGHGGVRTLHSSVPHHAVL